MLVSFKRSTTSTKVPSELISEMVESPAAFDPSLSASIAIVPSALIETVVS